MLRLHDGTLAFSASDITAHLACPHLEQQRLAIARGERGWPAGGVDAHAELARRRGDRHEAAAYARLVAEAGMVVDLDDELDWRDPEALRAAAVRSAAAMRARAPLIFQPVLFDGRWAGRADFLRLAEHGYEVLDAKLSRVVKPAMVHQLALYARLAGASSRAGVILGDGTRQAVDLTRFAALHRRVVARVEAVARRETF